jgi:hypothetical protein
VSALARHPEVVREQRERELDFMIVRAQAELHDIRRDAAFFQRRVEKLLRPRWADTFWRVLAGVLSVPVLLIASWFLICSAWWTLLDW